MTLDSYIQQVSTAGDILAVNAVRDTAQMDRDLSATEFLSLVRIVIRRKQEILNLNIIKQ